MADEARNLKQYKELPENSKWLIMLTCCLSGYAILVLSRVQQNI